MANYSYLSSTAYPIIFKHKKISFNVAVRIYCDNGFLIPDCAKKCTPQNDTNAHYDCDYSKGEKVCLPGWFGEITNCIKYCVPQHNQYGHFKCSRTGNKMCLKYWYGTNCTTYCKESNDPTGHYLCNTTTGLKICHPEWYGTNCTKHCKESNDSTGHYLCNTTTGLKICHPEWYGTNCMTHCTERDVFSDDFCQDQIGIKINLIYFYWHLLEIFSVSIMHNTSLSFY